MPLTSFYRLQQSGIGGRKAQLRAPTKEKAMLNKKRGKIIPLTQWNKNGHVWPTQGALRSLAFHSSTNGFDKVLIRAGGRLLLDEDAFYDWLDEQNEVLPNALENNHA